MDDFIYEIVMGISIENLGLDDGEFISLLDESIKGITEDAFYEIYSDVTLIVISLEVIGNETTFINVKNLLEQVAGKDNTKYKKIRKYDPEYLPLIDEILYKEMDRDEL